ncbi:hypothetical protein IEN85_10810 [Pelagicoccus sp. NFK12]|uniref:Uncharacterized protein n=1 Tax=Pelagicoccus enzymogenes TaxID=2773457 RepID=A0A927F7X3_9BACT|nr:hypothetical protein [Pelagicoccus enzymogenes]MBD5779979.1 hypothetical protein [Pelagicoccus enzymogenes]
MKNPLRILYRRVTWTSLRSLGESKAVKSSVFWFLVTPIAAKLVFALKNDVLPHTNYSEWANALVLPFPWWVLYFASLFFAIGRLSFMSKCPKVIRDYASYRDFREAGVASFQLTEWYMDIVENDPLTKNDQDRFTNGHNVYLNLWVERCFGEPLEELIDRDTLENGEFSMISYAIWELNIPEKRIGDAFHMVTTESDKLHQGWAKFTFICFGLGLLAILLLIIRNLWYVLQTIN